MSARTLNARVLAARTFPTRGLAARDLAAPALLTLVLLALSGGPLLAQQMRTIEERSALRPDATVEVRAIAHSVTVERWDRNEIEITGEYDAEWEEPRVQRGDRSFRFELESLNRRGTHSWSGTRELRVRVPAGVRIDIGTVSGGVRVSGIAGAVSASSVSGAVEVEGDPASVRINSVSGRVTYRGAATSIDAQSVSGSADVTATRPVNHGGVTSVSGSVSFAGALAQGGRLNVNSHSGNVEVTLPRNVDARFSLSTFSGRVTADLPGAEGGEHERSRFVPAESLRFTAGSGSGQVEAKSFSGNVRVRSGG